MELLQMMSLSSMSISILPPWKLLMLNVQVVNINPWLDADRYIPSSGFTTPFLPWIPAAGVMMNCFLLGTLTQISFLFWGVWMLFSIIIYLSYGERRHRFLNTFMTLANLPHSVEALQWKRFISQIHLISILTLVLTFFRFISHSRRRGPSQGGTGTPGGCLSRSWQGRRHWAFHRGEYPCTGGIQVHVQGICIFQTKYAIWHRFHPW